MARYSIKLVHGTVYMSYAAAQRQVTALNAHT